MDFIEPENILFQAGYLTIENIDFDGSVTWYKLRYPNHEVKRSLNEYLLYSYSHDRVSVSRHQRDLRFVLTRGDIDGVMTIMRSHFVSIPYDWYKKNDIDQYEGYYASVFYAYFASIGVEVRAEEPTSYGKVDMAVIMPNAVYVFAFKVIEGGEGTGEALEQIKQKGYADRHKGIGRGVSRDATIYLVGIEFSKNKRQIAGYYKELIN